MPGRGNDVQRTYARGMAGLEQFCACSQKVGGVFISLIAEPAGGRTDPKPPFPHPKAGGVMAAKEQAYSKIILGAEHVTEVNGRPYRC